MVSKVKATVEFINIAGTSVYEFILKPQGRIPLFYAGQFLHLAIDEYDPSFEWPESRVFSIASGNTRKNMIRIIVSVKGLFTQRMCEKLTVNSSVWLKLPYGNFNFDKTNDNLILIAGGTGIAPYISYIEECLDKNINRKINLLYGLKSSQLNLFHNFLYECKNKMSNFDFTQFSENGEIGYENGIINLDKIDFEKNKESQFYLSGPELMVSNYQNLLLRKGIEKEKIHIDKWQ